jgi:transcriptional regulator with XRE-family HTH domain
MEFGKNLVKLRKEKGMSQSELAEELGVSRQAVSRWEGGTSLPSIENLKCISTLYGVSLDDLLREEQDSVPEQHRTEETPAQAKRTARKDNQRIKTTPFLKRVGVLVFILFLVATIIVLFVQMLDKQPKIVSMKNLKREESFSVSEETFSINW